MTSGGIRDRFRAEMREEVKNAALRQLAGGGPAALSLNAIAKELGVSGPALYRYFAGRDALLTELIVDAYADLAQALRAVPPNLTDQAAAYRSWALGQPHRYRLLFGAPLPGYDAHDDRLVVAAQQAMKTLLAAVTATPTGPDREPVTPQPELAGQLNAWIAVSHGSSQPPADAAVALHAVTLWSRLHGFVSLEIEGNFASMGLDPDLLFKDVWFQ